MESSSFVMLRKMHFIFYSAQGTCVKITLYLMTAMKMRMRSSSTMMLLVRQLQRERAAFAFPFGGNNASTEMGYAGRRVSGSGSGSGHYAGKTVESVGVAAFVATPIVVVVVASTVHVINFMSA